MKGVFLRKKYNTTVLSNITPSSTRLKVEQYMDILSFKMNEIKHK